MGSSRQQPKTPLLFVAALTLALGLGFLGGRRSATRPLLERVDTVTVRDTVVVHDTVEVEVPIVFSRYRGDNYDIGVSGFRTELDYVKVYPQTKIVTKGYSIEPKRWGFGVAVGPSVLVAPSGRVNAGLGVTGGFYLRL